MRSSAFGWLACFVLSIIPVATATPQCLSAELVKNEDGYGTRLALDTPWLALSQAAWQTPQGVVVGAVHLYRFGSQGWTLSQTLAGPTSLPLSGFGASIALQGRTLLVGATGPSGSGGRVHVFEKTGPTWVETQVIQYPGTSGNQTFGGHIELDGDQALIGTGPIFGPLPLPEVWLFERHQGQWSPVQELDSGPSIKSSGWGIGLALRGDTAAVTDPGDKSLGGVTHGSVYVFQRGGTAWSLVQKLVHPDGPIQQQGFGSAVEIENDWLFAGSSSANTFVPSSVAVFLRSAGSWQPFQVLRRGSATGFGGSLDAVGDQLLAGEPEFSPDRSLILYRRIGGVWLVESEFDSPTYQAGMSQILMGSEVALDPPFLVGNATCLPEGKPGGAYVFDIGAGSVTKYCTGAPNSAGSGASMSSLGPNSISANDFTLVVDGLPAQVPGTFYYGSVAQQLPFGNGFGCVGAGSTGIFRLLPVQYSFGDGQVTRKLDYTVPPANTGAGQILPGSTWCFQYWFRDPAGGGSGFNFSDAISVTFCP